MKKLFSRHDRWFWLSLCVPLYFGGISLYYSLSQDYIIQDDARQHVVWLQRFVNRKLFREDLIADYFQSHAPSGYKALYWSLAQLGMQPIDLARVLPIALGLIATVYYFRLAMEILPRPVGAFIATLIFNQIFWLDDDVISATPRAFLYPLFAAFLHYLLQGKLLPCLVTMALQGLFYPQLLLVEVAVLTVRLWPGSQPSPGKKYRFWLSGLAVAIIVLLPFAIAPSSYGPVVTAAEMKLMPEFQSQGRNAYFGVHPLILPFKGSAGLGLPLFPTVVWLSLGLPFILKSKLSLVKDIQEKINIIWQVAIASLVMYCLAHLLLPRLHLPSRYTGHSLKFIVSIATAIVILGLREWSQKWSQRKGRERLTRIVIRMLAIVLIVVPAIPPLFLSFQGWEVGEQPELYQFLARQPPDTLVASLGPEADNLPAFSQRSVLISREFALAYHSGYYNQIKERAIDLIRAQYSPDLSVTQKFIQKYAVDYIMVERDAFTADYLRQQKWPQHSSFREVWYSAIAQLESNATPALAKIADRCGALATDKLLLIDAKCITEVE